MNMDDRAGGLSFCGLGRPRTRQPDEYREDDELKSRHVRTGGPERLPISCGKRPDSSIIVWLARDAPGLQVVSLTMDLTPAPTARQQICHPPSILRKRSSQIG